jgi:hypothetical protein
MPSQNVKVNPNETVFVSRTAVSPGWTQMKRRSAGVSSARVLVSHSIGVVFEGETDAAAGVHHGDCDQRSVRLG